MPWIALRKAGASGGLEPNHKTMAMEHTRVPSFFVMPSLACPAKCKYCYSPHASPCMSPETMTSSARWIGKVIRSVSDRNACDAGATQPALPVRITFHGGEPLVMPPEFYRHALPLLTQAASPLPHAISLQSNLWLLSSEHCEVFAEHGVRLGTSLDGPEDFNDAQRGAGYFARTMAGIRRAREHGLQVGCICTLTADSVPHVRQIFEFFLAQKMDFAFFMAQPVLGKEHDCGWVATPDQQAAVVEELIGLYLEHWPTLRISTLDQLLRSAVTDGWGGCVLGNCLGRQFAIDSYGGIYNCQMFAGREDHKWDVVDSCPSLEELAGSPGWRQFDRRLGQVQVKCAQCSYLRICSGGCAYNALMAGAGSFDANVRDPNCPAYSRMMDLAIDRIRKASFFPSLDRPSSVNTKPGKLTPDLALNLILRGYVPNRSQEPRAPGSGLDPRAALKAGITHIVGTRPSAASPR